jgi:hypothetical protein
VAIAALRNAVESVEEAGRGVSEVSQQLQPYLTKTMNAEEKVGGIFNHLLVVRQRAILLDKASGDELEMLVEAAQAVFAKINAAHSEVSEIGEESALACAEAAASLAELLQPPDEVLKDLGTKKVTTAIRYCKERDRLLSVYPAEPTIDACQNGLKWLATFLTNAPKA